MYYALTGSYPAGSRPRNPFIYSEIGCGRDFGQIVGQAVRQVGQVPVGQVPRVAEHLVIGM